MLGGEKKISFHTVPFHIQTQRLSILSLPGTAATLLSYLSWQLDLVTARLEGGGEGLKIWLERNMGWTPFVTRVHSQLSGEPSKSFFPLALFRSGPRKDAIFCTFLGDASCVQGFVQYHQKYFLLVSAETWQDIWKDLITLWLAMWPDWKLLFRAC